MTTYDFLSIEARWQAHWEEHKTFRAVNPGDPGFDPARPKYYVLDMFPYPSGVGLHVGHPLGYIATDIVARYKRMRGYNVLHPMGYDAFGLPAEQYAVEHGVHPRVTTEANIANMERQLKRLGLSYDWDRRLATTDVGYYSWTQWIFLQLYNSWSTPPRAGPADRRADPEAGVGRAGRRARRRSRARGGLRRDERAGRCAGGHAPLVRAQPGRAGGRAGRAPPGLPGRGAGELVPGPRHGAGQRGSDQRGPQRPRQPPGLPPPAAAVDAAHHRLRRAAARRPRPGRLARADQAHAAQLDRPAARAPASTSRSTAWTRRSASSPRGRTRCSAPPTWCSRPSTRWSSRSPPPSSAARSKRTSGRGPEPTPTLARTAQAKTGVFTGAYAINPVNRERIPIWVADYVLMGYGTGAIMAVPAHDSATSSSPRHSACRSRVVVMPDDQWLARHARPDGDEPAGILPSASMETLRRRYAETPAAFSEAFVGDGVAINCTGPDVSLDGLPTPESKQRITAWLESSGLGERQREVQAPRLALQPAAVLGRAVPDPARAGRADPRRWTRRTCPWSCRRWRTSARPRATTPTPQPHPPLGRAPGVLAARGGATASATSAS